MASALFPRTVSQIAVAMTFVVALLSSPVLPQGVSRSQTTSGKSSGVARKLIQPEELARILQTPKGVCRARNTSFFTAGAVLGANVRTLTPHMKNCALWDFVMSSCSTLRTTSAKTGSRCFWQADLAPPWPSDLAPLMS
jgi:hypothetical protein